MVVEDKFADEIMSDDELDKVAGGTWNQTASDSQFLYDYGLMDTYHYPSTMSCHLVWVPYSREVDEGWARAGITCVTKYDEGESNQYFLGGKEISSGEAYEYVKAKFKRIHYVTKDT